MASAPVRLLPLIFLLPLLLSPFAVATTYLVPSPTCTKRSISPALSSLDSVITSYYLETYYFDQFVAEINRISLIEAIDFLDSINYAPVRHAAPKWRAPTTADAPPLFAFITPGAITPGGTFNSITNYTMSPGSGVGTGHLTYSSTYTVSVTLPTFDVTFGVDIFSDSALPKTGASTSTAAKPAAASASTGASGATTTKDGRKLQGRGMGRRKLQGRGMARRKLQGATTDIVGDVIVSGFQLTFTAPAVAIANSDLDFPLTEEAFYNFYNFSLTPLTATLKASYSGFFGDSPNELIINKNATITLDLTDGAYVQLICAQKTALQCSTEINIDPFYVLYLLGYGNLGGSNQFEDNVFFFGTIGSVALPSTSGTDFKNGC